MVPLSTPVSKFSAKGSPAMDVYPIKEENRITPSCFMLHVKNYGGQSFAVALPRPWNALPMAVKRSNTVDIFKRQLKSHLFLCSYVNC